MFLMKETNFVRLHDHRKPSGTMLIVSYDQVKVSTFIEKGNE
jgi:hypothetical protein